MMIVWKLEGKMELTQHCCFCTEFLLITIKTVFQRISFCYFMLCCSFWLWIMVCWSFLFR